MAIFNKNSLQQVFVSSVFGWIMRMLWTASQELKSDLAKLREELPNDDNAGHGHDVILI